MFWRSLPPGFDGRVAIVRIRPTRSLAQGSDTVGGSGHGGGAGQVPAPAARSQPARHHDVLHRADGVRARRRRVRRGVGIRQQSAPTILLTDHLGTEHCASRSCRDRRPRPYSSQPVRHSRSGTFRLPTRLPAQGVSRTVSSVHGLADRANGTSE
jgi:hypothetical protein